MAIKINKDLHYVEVTKRSTIFTRETTISDNYTGGDADSLIEIEISEGFTEIAEGAFENCKALTKVTLPASVKVIGRNAFAGCTSLETVVVKGTLERIAHDCDKWATYGKLTARDLTRGSELRLYYQGDDDPRQWS